MEVLTGPTEERTELVRKDDEVENESHRGQHEHQVAHGFFPTDMLSVLSK